jgi:rhodanese-related sulfurtransferase
MRIRIVAVGAAVLAITSLSLVGCSSTDSASSSSVASQGPQAPVAAPATPERVDAAAFADAVASPGIVTIDVRTPEEFSAGHIEGAVNYNVEGPDFAAQLASLDPAATYAVYCRSGNRSQVAVAAMSGAGINHIYELESGIVGWEEAGLPVVS